MKHIVGFSGGVDSQACARWVLNRFPADDVILCNSTAGDWEDPLTIEFVATYSATVHPVVVVHAIVADMWTTPGFAETKGLDGAARLTMEEMIRIKGRPPSRKAQFCTEILKLIPQRRWMRAQFGVGGPYEGQDYSRYKGVRRDESNTRRDTVLESWDSYFDCPLFAPLFDWSKQMCFDYVKAHGEPINPLYTLGFNRVGCAPCINSSKADIVNWAARRPEMIDKVRAMEDRIGRTFFAPVDRDGQTNRIDDVVMWARTSRGGTNRLLPMMHEREGCESKYGLCE
jgi:3'-phosphoadenosine 5'-phosphosulfate sulfotransferase (PAPS reductase)/FAD synthetase